MLLVMLPYLKRQFILCIVWSTTYYHLGLQPPSGLGLDRRQLWELDAFPASNLCHIIPCHQVNLPPYSNSFLTQYIPSPPSLICALTLSQLQSGRVESSSWFELARRWAQTATQLPILLLTLLFRVESSFIYLN